MTNNKYYFWLIGWKYNAFYPIRNAYISCEVDQSGFTIHDSKNPLHVTWHQVSKLNLVSEHIGLGERSVVKVFLPVGTKVRTIHLFVMNAMSSASIHHVQEHETLFDVMNAFRNHLPVTAHPNPYYRAFERVGKLDYFLLQNWDPTVSPREYRKHPAIRNAVFLYQKRGFLWIYWITTVFLAFASLLILFQGGQDELDAVAILVGMWLFMTMIFSWIIFSSSRDFEQ